MAKQVWHKSGFDGFMKGSFGNGGQNLYVSKSGVLQRIHLYDITGNGYPDLIFSNSQSMGERPKLDVYCGCVEGSSISEFFRLSFGLATINVELRPLSHRLAV